MPGWARGVRARVSGRATGPTQLVQRAFGACLLLILVLIAGFSDWLPRYYRQLGALPNVALLALAIGVAVLVARGPVRFRARFRQRFAAASAPSGDRPDAFDARFLAPAVFALLCWQLFVIWNLRFVTGWDAGGIYRDAWSLHQGVQPVMSTVHYYSSYPNNLMLLSIERALVDAVGARLGFEDTYLLLACLNALIAAASSALTYLVARAWAGRGAAIGSWVLYALLIGFSPWSLVVYSDALALFVPVGVLALYVLRPVPDPIAWLLMGLLTAFGYAVKPQCVFVAAALALVELGGLLRAGRSRAGARRVAAVALLVVGFAAGHAACTQVTDRTATAVGIDRKGAFTPVHFAMMGLNAVSDGGYDATDVRFSRSYVDPGARVQGELGVIAARLERMGPAGLAGHAVKKLLSTWADGTFAWAAEGGFWQTPVLMRGNPATDLLRELYVRTDFAHPGERHRRQIARDGAFFAGFASAEQLVWFLVLAGMASVGLLGSRGAGPSPRGYLAALIAILMLAAFELVFEARARYLYIYVPIMVAVAAAALRWHAGARERGREAPGAPRAGRSGSEHDEREAS